MRKRISVNLQFDSYYIYVYGVYNHSRKPFHAVFHALFQGLGNRVDGYAVFDNNVYVDINPVAVGNDFYAAAVGLFLYKLDRKSVV